MVADVHSSESDQSLVSRIKGGDDRAAELLYYRYSARLHGLADRQISSGLKPVLGPDDIVQSAFRSLFRGVNSGSYSAPESGSLWSLLAVIAIHKIRRKASRNRSVVAMSESQLDGEASMLPEVEDSLSQEQVELSVREAIEGLQPLEQTVVEYRMQGLTVEEISEKIDRSCRTVERMLQRIREKLSDLLEEDFSGVSGNDGGSLNDSGL